MKPRALLSLSDKKHLESFAHALARRGFELVATSGTAKTLRSWKLEVADVSELTGFPEILGGRVKTLHPLIHAGLLARSGNVQDQATLNTHRIKPFAVVAINLYPFAAGLERQCGFEEQMELMDIGGPAMIRAAAKNHQDVLVLTDPSDYEAALAEFDQPSTQPKLRLRLAYKALAHTAHYDSTIAGFLAAQLGLGPTAGPHFVVGGNQPLPLRYGENPHQSAVLYRDSSQQGVAHAVCLQGKELSYNNLLDADAAWHLCSQLEGAAAVIVKHNNPCGAAQAASLREAFERALSADKTSSFGGIVAFNGEVDRACAEALSQVFIELVIAPAWSAEALRLLSHKKNLRLLKLKPGGGSSYEVRTLSGGLLVQAVDNFATDCASWQQVSGPVASAQQLVDLRLAWKVAAQTKSNAIVLARDNQIVGVGAGQMSRVDSVFVALRKAAQAGFDPAGAVAASDAFFPFADGLTGLIEAGISHVVHPGGSVRDDEVSAAARKAGIGLWLTGQRHFRH